VDEAQILGSRIRDLENWFEGHRGVYDGLKRDELRTLYITAGDETKGIQQSDIILANQFNDEKTLLVLSASSTDSSEVVSVDRLQLIAARFPQFQYVRSASLTRAADLLAARGQVKAALAPYRQAVSGPTKYSELAKSKYLKLKRTDVNKLGRAYVGRK
jgi:hypothetical protein